MGAKSYQAYEIQQKKETRGSLFLYLNDYVNCPMP